MSLLLGIIYLSFISLGLPDALLGAAWPDMYPEFQVPVSYAGMISMIIAFGTIISSLQSDHLTKKFGTGIEYTGYATPAAESPPPSTYCGLLSAPQKTRSGRSLHRYASGEQSVGSGSRQRKIAKWAEGKRRKRK